MTNSLVPPVSLDTTQPNLGVPDFRTQLEAGFDAALKAGTPIREVVLARAEAVDALLKAIFDMLGLGDTQLALFAVGGYGRGELAPFSDIDILLFSETKLDEASKTKIEQFAAKLWDIKLEPGLSVRTAKECLDAAKDLTVASSLLEARFLCGNMGLQHNPKRLMELIWNDKSFYEAKREEQIARYKNHNSTEYNLEPNIKSAPGGLRDIHHIGWVCKRYFRVNKLSDLVNQSFLTNSEYSELERAEDFLWLLRHHLHRAAGRSDNRLLFDFQREVAARMGYTQEHLADKHPNAEIEAFMRDYYSQAMRVSTLSEMLNAYYEEALIEPRLPDSQKPKVIRLSDEFEQIGNKIAVTHSAVFSKNPSALLKLFVLMGVRGIKEIRAKTLRLLKTNAHLIDDEFRDDPNNRGLFMSIIAEPNYLFHRLRKMKRYGILGAYLPAFGQVMGLMQYDLFHRYTVDAHTLLLIRVLHRFTDETYKEQFAEVGQIYSRIERKELVHLAVLFHDIAKGRGGDHSELGAADAFEFCRSHGLGERDANLVSWLVRFHLLMSLTSQKQDISDPEVLQAFADKVGDIRHLDHLYVLTVADMNATNAELWNSWRASLMRQLYHSTQHILHKGLSKPIDRDSLITQSKSQAMTMLSGVCDVAQIQALWADLSGDYFLRENVSDIVWHTAAILTHGDSSTPLILVRKHKELAQDAVQVFVYTQDKPNLFAATVNVFNKMNLDVQDARITTASRDFALDTYILIDPHGTLLGDDMRQDMLKDAILDALQTPTAPKLAVKRLPRQLKHFDVQTSISHRINDTTEQNELTISTLDQPGLLALIGCVFMAHEIEIHAARITTLGERAEDVFAITNRDDALLTEAQIGALTQDLIATLDDDHEAAGNNLLAEIGT